MFTLWKKILKAKGLTGETTGTITQIQQRVSHFVGHEATNIPTFFYVVDGIEYVSSAVLSFFNRSMWDWAKEGDKVIIYYDKKSPERFQAIPDKDIIERGKFDYILVNVILPAFIGIGLLYLIGLLVRFVF